MTSVARLPCFVAGVMCDHWNDQPMCTFYHLLSHLGNPLNALKCSLSCFLKALVEFVMLGTHALTIARLIHLFLRTSQLVGFVTVQNAFNLFDQSPRPWVRFSRLMLLLLLLLSNCCTQYDCDWSTLGNTIAVVKFLFQPPDFTAMCGPGCFWHDSPAVVRPFWFSHDRGAVGGIGRSSTFYDGFYLGK